MIQYFGFTLYLNETAKVKTNIEVKRFIDQKAALHSLLDINYMSLVICLMAYTFLLFVYKK